VTIDDYNDPIDDSSLFPNP